jgi:hypothetical protein
MADRAAAARYPALPAGISQEDAVMTENQHPVVGKIIDAFRAGLSDSAREQISSAQFADLASMIDQAIDAEAGTAAELVEQVARTLRERARGPELGL